MVGFSRADDYEWSASNFEIIQGDEAVRVGDSPTVQNFKKNFFATGIGYGGAGNK